MAAAILECAICADALFGSPPTTAACGHNFHMPCLGSWISSEQARAHEPSCPVCRGRVAVNAADLRINHDLEALLATLAAAQAAQPPAPLRAPWTPYHSGHAERADHKADCPGTLACACPGALEIWVLAAAPQKVTPRSGKWMLFPEEHDADAAWAVVARRKYGPKPG